MKIVYLDMDGVLANFREGVGRPNFEKDPPEMFEKGFFRNLPLMPFAREGVDALLKHSYIDLYIATKPTTGNLWCATEKYQWIEQHFPELLKKMLVICDKGHLNGDYLIDDDKDQWGDKFRGTFVHFNEFEPEGSWKKVLEYMSRYK